MTTFPIFNNDGRLNTAALVKAASRVVDTHRSIGHALDVHRAVMGDFPPAALLGNWGSEPEWMFFRPQLVSMGYPWY